MRSGESDWKNAADMLVDGVKLETFVIEELICDCGEAGELGGYTVRGGDGNIWAALYGGYSHF